jgi:hypothetical protein
VDSAQPGQEVRVLKTNRKGWRVRVAFFALGVGLLVLPTWLEGPKAAGISRVGWLEVCGPGHRIWASGCRSSI